jgi:hypothetical protein
MGPDKGHPIIGHKVPEGTQKCTSTLSLNSRLGWQLNITSRPLYPRERNTVPILQEAGWAAGRSERVRKISPPPKFDTRTVQPAASRYTDCASPFSRNWCIPFFWDGVRQSIPIPWKISTRIHGVTSHRLVTFRFQYLRMRSRCECCSEGNKA